jgi:hypothetical protein
LIVLDFLLSLSAKAKEKLAKANLPDNLNKSVLYADQLLADDDVRALSPFSFNHTSAFICDYYVLYACCVIVANWSIGKLGA